MYARAPRRFGKSLLLSTLEAYFLGRKEVFKGLAIEQLEKDWKVYPVLHLSLNAQYYEDKRSLEQVFEVHFIEWEKQYGKTDKEVGYAGRFMQIIRQACEKTGEKVVVLIDEYDKPLLRTLFNDDLEDLFSSEEISFERRKQQAFAKTARAAQEYRISGNSHSIDQSRFINIQKIFFTQFCKILYPYREFSDRHCFHISVVFKYQYKDKNNEGICQCKYR